MYVTMVLLLDFLVLLNRDSNVGCDTCFHFACSGIRVQFNSLVSINLSRTPGSLHSKQLVTAEGATMLADSLRGNTSLTVLELDFNHVGHAGALALSSALLANNTLGELSLVANGIGDLGAMHFAAALSASESLSVLRVLRLDSNTINDLGAQKLAQSLALNSTLRELSLNENLFSHECFPDFISSLSRNQTLQALRLADCTCIFDAELSQSLIAAAAAHPALSVDSMCLAQFARKDF